MYNNKLISRHKTAIRRINLSRPIQLALDSALITSESSVLDYGCGRGDDVRALKDRGIDCMGWDPKYLPDNLLKVSDIVNLGYVINVIENIKERNSTLYNAWKYTKKALIISARLKHESKGMDLTPHGDGFITSRGTFQKFFTQQELRDLINSELEIACIAVSPGIFIAFKDDLIRQQFLANQNRRVLTVPSIKRSDSLFEKHKDILNLLANFITERGRPPIDDEIEYAHEINNIFGSIKRAFSIIKRVTGTDKWDKIAEDRSQDLLVNLSLQKFLGKPKFSLIPRDIQLDIKTFFGSFDKAWKKAEEFLYSAGNLIEIDKACRTSKVGKLTHDALYIHKCALDLLPPILRIYEGCARNYVGEPDGANIIKIHRQKPKVSYLSYPDFDTVAHPTLHNALIVPLRELNVKYLEWTSSDNPPILHRKEEFVPEVYHSRNKFKRLTQQEEKAGLYENPRSIGMRQQWEQLLLEKKVKITGHRLQHLGN